MLLFRFGRGKEEGEGRGKQAPDWNGGVAGGKRQSALPSSFSRVDMHVQDFSCAE